MKIIWSELSVERLNSIINFISEDNLQNALSWSESIFDQVDKLKKFPEMGRILPELNSEKIRELILGNYRVIYKVEPKYISILTIRNFRQILPTDEVK